MRFSLFFFLSLARLTLLVPLLPYILISAYPDNSHAARPPSALSAFRSMTPISNYSSSSTGASNPSTSPVRPRSLLSQSSSSTSASRRATSEYYPSNGAFAEEEAGEEQERRRSRSRSRKKEARFFVGSAPSVSPTMSRGLSRGRGPSFGEVRCCFFLPFLVLSFALSTDSLSALVLLPAPFRRCLRRPPCHFLIP